MKKHACLSALLLLLLALPHTLRAEGPEEDVLRPLLVRFFVGPMAGIGYNLHLGNFQTLCKCTYSGGTGAGPTGGLFAEIPVSRSWRISGGFTYNDLRADFTRQETRLEYGSTGEFVNIQFEQTASVNLSYIGFQAMAKWISGLGGLYLAAGPSISFLVSNHIKETERIVTPGWVYKQNMQNQNVFLDGDIPSYRQNRLAVHAAAGYDFFLPPKLVISPELGYQMPLTSVTSSDANWGASALQLMVFVKFGL
jgi:hypothetical protein